jgi:RNA polymerase sigma factor (sigma-70 family)
MPFFSTATWLENERDLIESIRSEDAKLSSQAETVYVTAYSRRLFLFLRRYAVNDMNTEDLCQQTWEQALPRLRDGRYVHVPGKSSLSWLISIGLNLLRQWRRSWARDQARCTRFGHHLDTTLQAGSTPEDALASNEARARVRRALLVLPSAQRDAVTKLYISGIHDTAERRRLSGNACKGLQKLKLALDAEELGHVEDF